MSTIAQQWLTNTRAVMDRIEQTQLDAIRQAAGIMADTIQAERWVHTFGCGHATIPIEEMYPRIGGFVGFHPMCELPLTFLRASWAKAACTSLYSWSAWRATACRL